MNIDRARFLVLTGMISAAAVACTIQNKKEEPGAGESQPAPGADQSDGGTPTLKSSKDAATDPSTTDGGDADGGEGGSDAATCIGSDGNKPDCSSSKCSYECETVAGRFKAGIAGPIAGCIEMSPTCESMASCVADNIAPTVPICDDPTAATFCQPLVDDCKQNAEWGGDEITQEKCVAMAKTLTAVGRDQFASCVTEGMTTGYCTWGSAWCLDAMKY